MRIAVATTFATWPPRGGAAVRNFHLYRHVARRHEVELVAIVQPVYGELDSWIAPGLRERRIVESRRHFAEEERMSARVGGAPVSDLATVRLIHLAPRYLEALKASCDRADVVVASHPYLLPAIREVCAKPLVYESPDVEVDLKGAILPHDVEGRELLALVQLAETNCCREAALVLACSAEERERLIALYHLDPAITDVAPNGADIEGVRFIGWDERRRNREARGAAQPTALFLGSWHRPNNEAAKYVVELARSLPQVRFVVAGSAGEAIMGIEPPSNLVVTREVDEETKVALLRDADVALNPVLDGAGTNLKTLEYCASGLPVVSTAFACRGHGLQDETHLLVRTLDQFPSAVLHVLDAANHTGVCAMVDRARAHVAKRTSWDAIGERVASRIEGVVRKAPSSKAPTRDNLVSVLVPMYNAEPFIEECLDSVLAQSHSNLEVLVVDDGSRDGSAEVVRRVAARDARVRLFTHPDGINRGKSSSLELALAHARGKRVALLDADDAFERDKIALQMAAMDAHPEVVLCHTLTTIVSEIAADFTSHIDNHFARFMGAEPYRMLDAYDALKACHILCSSVMADAQAMRSIPFAGPQWFQSEDWLLCTLLATRGPFLHLPQKLVRYRLHPKSYTSRVLTSSLGTAYAHIEFLLMAKAKLDDPELLERIERRLQELFAEAGAMYSDPRKRLEANEDVEAPTEICANVSLALADPATVDVLHKRQLEVIVTNRSGYVLATELPHPVYLSYHWLDAHTGKVISWDGRRSVLDLPLAPGYSRRYAVDVELPEGAGIRDLTLRVTLIAEGRFWFDDHAPGYLDVPVAAGESGRMSSTPVA